jgi:solute carrier family 9B (sodium/hydrogen exchanger), member 1/2
MLLKIIIIFSSAFFLGKLAEKIKLPALMGYITCGLLFSPYTDLFSQSLPLSLSKTELVSSGPFRIFALFVILYRAGLGLDKAGLQENGGAAIRLAFIPCLCEAITISCIAHYFLGFPWPESALLAFVIAAVSPAVIVPMMLDLKEKRLGTNKNIPTLILASATLDDIIAITGFGVALSILAVHSQESWLMTLIFLPFAIITGISSGLLLIKPLQGLLQTKKIYTSFKVIILIALAFLLKEIEELKLFPFSYLLAIMTFGFAIREQLLQQADDIAEIFYKIWKVAEIILFVLIGAMVDLELALQVGFSGLSILLGGLTARSIATYFSLANTKLNSKERIFCTLAYLPKATVQATIGGMALTYFYSGSIKLYKGAEMGELILAMAAMSILITAPLGALCIRFTSSKLLQPDKL